MEKNPTNIFTEPPQFGHGSLILIFGQRLD